MGEQTSDLRARVRRTLGPVALGAGWIASAAFAADTFVERTAEVGLIHEVITGLDRTGDSGHLYDWAQTGVALGDVDGDGDIDVFACGGLLPNRLFRNDGGTFTDITVQAGLESNDFDRTAALGDYDADGDLDLWVGVLEGGDGPIVGRSRLYRNDGTGTFEEVTQLAGVTGSGHSLHGKWADLNRDGLLDLYVSEFHGTPNHYYRNNGDGSFTDVGPLVGADVTGSTHITGIVDTDGDGCDDIFVGNDWMVSDSGNIVQNIGDRELHCGESYDYVDVTSGSGNEFLRAVMGIAYADVNYDGLLDMYKADALANHLMINNGWPASGQPWTEEQDVYDIVGNQVPDLENPGTFGTAISWAVAFYDFDHDRFLDLFLVNGHVAGLQEESNTSPRNQQNYLYRGLGPSQGYRFADDTELSGLGANVDDRAAAVADFDGDGDMDLIVVPTAGAMRYYENQIDLSGRNWLQVAPECHTSAPGCPGVRVMREDVSGILHIRVLGVDAPTASHGDERTAHFGLLGESSTDVTVDFRSGIRLEFQDVPANTVLRPVEPELIRLDSRTVERSRAGDPNFTRVTVFAHDRAGQPLDSSADVDIVIPGVSPAGPVQHVSGNQFERTFEVPTSPGGYTVEVRFDEFQVSTRPVLHVYGLASPVGSNVWVEPDCVRAGSDDLFTVTLVAKDARGLSLGGGQSVDARIGEQEPISSIDQGDGRYTFVFEAPSLPGTYSGDVIFGGNVVGGGGQIVVEAAGIPSLEQTDVYEEVPYEIHSASPELLKMMVTPRDAVGRQLGPATGLSVEIDRDFGTAPIDVLAAHPRGQRDGVFVIVLDKSGGNPGQPARGTLRVFADSRIVVERSYDF